MELDLQRYAINQVHQVIYNLVHSKYNDSYYDGSYHNNYAAIGKLTLGVPRNLINEFVIRVLDILKYFHSLFPFSLLAREERLELPTPGFGDQCSTD